MNRSLIALLLVIVLWASCSAPAQRPDTTSRDPARLVLLQDKYPRAFFFRAAEGAARRRNADFDSWNASFSRLMGIMGKCLDEEVLNTELRNPDFFKRFKRLHPAQAVLLHFNGNARDPRYGGGRYFAGHWVYRRATRIVEDVPSESGESVIRVADASDFSSNMGRYRTASDDIALCGITADGRHDWKHCEQVQLIAVDPEKDTIRVRRGCYETRPLAFTAGKARAAAHAVEGPWGPKNNLLWYYNHASHCPRDAQGRACADVLVEELAEWFTAGGKLGSLDGLEFDVLFNETRGDTDEDGQVDNGVIDGVNQYGIGVIQFARKLRTRMGDGFIIMADGALGEGGRRSQRAFRLLNGIESEGWPNLHDWEMEDWSGGLNRHRFWQANARPPALHYINHKWNEPVPGKPGARSNPDVPFSRHRLVFAAGAFTDAAICYSFTPPLDPEGRLGIWDELRCGDENRLGWLGAPVGEAIHLAARTPDLLDGAGNPPKTSLAHRLQGDMIVKHAGQVLAVAAKNPAADALKFTILDVPTKGRELLVVARIKAESARGYPDEWARLAEVSLVGGVRSLLAGDAPRTAMVLRGQKETGLDEATGAYARFRPTQQIGAASLPCLAVHPPHRDKKGAVVWYRDAFVPVDAELRFSIGMGERSPMRSDGVWFRVGVAEPGAGDSVELFEKDSKQHAWLPQVVSLDRWAGKRVRLRFEADCGPHDNTVTDHAFWGDVRIVRRNVLEAERTAPKTIMTWLNQRPFTAVFYFRDVRSSVVDVDFKIEGPEPIVLESVTIHAHPDVMYREFENGLVLANPSLAPYTFDLSTLTPQRRYHRLRATANQDVKTNNGEDIGAQITLAPRDAVFLLRHTEK